ncbi:DUF4240 domain-containing protein [Bacillus sp. mrc49]|uniref:DUF4240 domain-containing protein n=1 Tax=Bacillus sp. mrc49 TaxID=2054913 RepID=UPI000C27B550|nr:DUF4240 domain-containing protein [Bacillus sp. mrc49]PJN87669.1 hypothetical protein CVN76_24445 [Bacillus sp. mrc49]
MQNICGSVFTMKLPNGKYGAIRIIKEIDNSFLVLTTPYLMDKLPKIHDNVLKQKLIQNRFFFDEIPAIKWVEGNIPNQYIYVGNIPLDPNESSIVSSTFSETWDNIGFEAYYEWRWENDREAFQSEVNEEPSEYKNNQKENDNDNNMMRDEIFWGLISTIQPGEKANEESLKVLISKLSKMKVKEIKQFEETLAKKLYLLDTKKHAENIAEFSFRDEGNFSLDNFLYARCAVVTKGEETYGEILSNPKKMIQIQNDTFEDLLYVASEAYKFKTKKAFTYQTQFDYETFSNKEEWS